MVEENPWELGAGGCWRRRIGRDGYKGGMESSCSVSPLVGGYVIQSESIGISRQPFTIL